MALITGAGGGLGRSFALAFAEAGARVIGLTHLVAGEADLPYHKPLLSKAFLKDPLQEPQMLRAERASADNGISLLLGQRVGGNDQRARTLQRAGGGKLSYDRLVLIANGQSSSE